MGVMRHVVNQSYEWRKVLDPNILFAIVALPMFAAALWKVLHIKDTGMHIRLSWLLLLLMCAFVSLFMLLCGNAEVRAYYQLLCLFRSVMLLQLVKCLLINIFLSI